MGKIKTTEIKELATKLNQIRFDSIIANTLTNYQSTLQQNILASSSLWSKLISRRCAECNKYIPSKNVNMRKLGVCSKKCITLKKLKLLK